VGALGLVVCEVIEEGRSGEDRLGSCDDRYEVGTIDDAARKGGSFCCCITGWIDGKAADSWS